jgi:RNA polymerase sigma-70 factor (ECF subfamily)
MDFNNDPLAFKEIVLRYHNELRSFAYIMLRDADLANDAVQDVFVYVWERRDTLSGKLQDGGIKPYLYRAVHNRALDILKHERAQNRLKESTRQFVLDEQAPELADTGVSAQELSAELDKALSMLTPRVREIFLMNRVHHMSYEEIAHALELSVPTVKSQVSRAAKTLVALFRSWNQG